MKLSLRPYQRDCLKDSLRDLRAGINSQLWVLPTASGKTAIASRVPQLIKQQPWEQMLFLVPWDDLVWQAKRHFEDANPDLSVEVEKAEHKASPDSDIIIGSVQSLGKKPKSGVNPRLAKLDPAAVRCIGCDEAHRTFSQAHKNILGYFNLLRSEEGFDRSKLLFGITATSNRHDGQGLEYFYEKISYQIPIKTLMTTGPTVDGAVYPYLAPPKIWKVSTEVDASMMAKKGRDLSEVDMSHTLDTYQRNRMIVNGYLEYGEGLPAICFMVDVKHAHHMVEVFSERGITAVAISGDTSRVDRDKAYAAYAQGDIRVICSCMAVSEGFDMPQACVALMARPTLSELFYQQCVGRIFRPCPAPEFFQPGHLPPAWIKRYSIIVDFCDVTQHPIQCAPSLFGLPPKFDMKGELAIETAEEVQKLVVQQGGMDLRECRDLDDVKMQVERVDCWRAPEVPEAVKRLSKLAWLEMSEGVYRLALGFDSLEVRESALGDYDVHHNQSGVQAKVHTSKSLRESIQAADRLVPPTYSAFLTAKAGWRRDPPSEPQSKLLYRWERKVREQFGSSDAFFAFASKKYRAGDMNFSKGGISRMLNRIELQKAGASNG